MFRFTIRDVLWLMGVVALGVGWWLEHRTLLPTIHRLRHVSSQLAEHLNGRDDLEVLVAKDHL